MALGDGALVFRSVVSRGKRTLVLGHSARGGQKEGSNGSLTLGKHSEKSQTETNSLTVNDFRYIAAGRKAMSLCSGRDWLSQPFSEKPARMGG